jgi:hypothetical protein
MSKNYQKECLYCNQKITMSDETGKWLPYNSDGTAHDCRNKNGNGNGKEPKQYTLEKVVKKLESIGVIVNVDRLMKQG